jgi:hypothetical protein
MFSSVIRRSHRDLSLWAEGVAVLSTAGQINAHKKSSLPKLIKRQFSSILAIGFVGF